MTSYFYGAGTYLSMHRLTSSKRHRTPSTTSVACCISYGKQPIPLPPSLLPQCVSSLTDPSCLLEIGIFASHIIWLIRTRKIRKEAAARGKTFDDILNEHEEQCLPFKFAERRSRKEARRQADEEVANNCALRTREGAEKGVASASATSGETGDVEAPVATKAEV